MSKEQMDAISQMLLANRPEEPPTIEEMRANMEAMTANFPAAEGETEAATMGGVPCEWAWGEGAREDAVLLYLHGGGYCLGSVNTHRNLVLALAKAAGIKALSVDYRLAPENPFPAAVDDAVAVYSALLDEGYDAAKIAIAGDSAGGGLTAALLLAARERGLPQPACGVLLSPWTDMEAKGESHQSRTEADPMVGKEGLLEMAGHYVGGGDPADPLASPLRADLGDLAPLLIHVGDAEVLLSDAIDFAERAKAAGVETDIKIWPDMIHVFQAFYPLVDEGRESIAEMGEFIAAKTA